MLHKDIECLLQELQVFAKELFQLDTLTRPDFLEMLYDDPWIARQFRTTRTPPESLDKLIDTVMLIRRVKCVIKSFLSASMCVLQQNVYGHRYTVYMGDRMSCRKNDVIDGYIVPYGLNTWMMVHVVEHINSPSRDQDPGGGGGWIQRVAQRVTRRRRSFTYKKPPGVSHDGMSSSESLQGQGGRRYASFLLPTTNKAVREFSWTEINLP